MAGDRSTPVRALVGARTVHRRAGEHALARAVGDERSAAVIEDAARIRRDAADAALTSAVASLRELARTGADAAMLALADAFASRRRRQLADAETDLAAARGLRSDAAAVTTDRQRDLTTSVAEQKVAERALDRITAEARRKRELRED